jgi:hypothetical protein
MVASRRPLSGGDETALNDRFWGAKRPFVSWTLRPLPSLSIADTCPKLPHASERLRPKSIVPSD